MSVFRVIQLHGAGDRPETLGTKEKLWIRLPHQNERTAPQHLFKIGRPNTGENWAERVVAEIATTLDLPCAEYELASFEGRRGVLTKKFMPDSGFFLAGNTLLSRILKDYDGNKRFGQIKYTPTACLNVVRRRVVDPPIQGDNSALQWFISYLVFDCFIGNTDRHHENWGIVALGLPNFDFSLRLAPTFDHASSLGRELTDNKRKFRLAAKDDLRGVEAYCARARSAFFGDDGLKRLTLHDLLTYLYRIDRDTVRVWTERIAQLERPYLVSVFDRVPADWISPPAAEFALAVLARNQERLRKVSRGD